MPLLCDMSLEDQLRYSQSVWSTIDIDPQGSFSTGVGCPHCHAVNTVPKHYDIQICICNVCEKNFTVTKKKIGPLAIEFYDATL